MEVCPFWNVNEILLFLYDFFALVPNDSVTRQLRDLHRNNWIQRQSIISHTKKSCEMQSYNLHSVNGISLPKRGVMFSPVCLYVGLFARGVTKKLTDGLR